MAGTAPRLPEQFQSPSDPRDFAVSELVSDAAGSHSPFGNLEFPLPVEKILYVHPKPEERPHLANGR
jgi:hypothetical protein